MTILEELETTIDDRRGSDPNHSWTARLLQGGRGECARKFGEEAVETVLAGVGPDRQALIREAADVIYHLMVLLAANDIRIESVCDELRERSGRSGIEEKSNRPPAAFVGPGEENDRHADP